MIRGKILTMGNVNLTMPGDSLSMQD